MSSLSALNCMMVDAGRCLEILCSIYLYLIYGFLNVTSCDISLLFVRLSTKINNWSTNNIIDDSHYGQTVNNTDKWMAFCYLRILGKSISVLYTVKGCVIIYIIMRLIRTK